MSRYIVCLPKKIEHIVFFADSVGDFGLTAPGGSLYVLTS
jgi:hypothetical protein